MAALMLRSSVAVPSKVRKMSDSGMTSGMAPESSTRNRDEMISWLWSKTNSDVYKRQVQDPWDGGSTYRVNSAWIEQYVAGGVFQG